MNIAHIIPEIKIKFFLARRLHCNDEYYSIISVIFQWTIRFFPSAYDKRLEESIDFLSSSIIYWKHVGIQIFNILCAYFWVHLRAHCVVYGTYLVTWWSCKMKKWKLYHFQLERIINLKMQNCLRIREKKLSGFHLAWVCQPSFRFRHLNF